LEVIVTELRSATSSMTSVPKPLKFLRPHFADLKSLHVVLENDRSSATNNDFILLRARLADVLSVLAMTMGDDGKYQFPALLFFSFELLSCIKPTAFYFLSKRVEKVLSSNFQE
jgi:hypothetical protein